MRSNTEELRFYRYRAVDTAGRRVRGTAAAVDPDDLYRQLRAQGLYLQSARERQERKRRMLKASALSDFCRQLSGMLSSGVNLSRSLGILAVEESMAESVKRSSAALLKSVRAGASLSEAMGKEGVFPELMLGMVRSGEATGRLDQALDRLADHYEKQHHTEQSVRSAMVYPIFLCVVAIAVVMGIFLFVLPQFRDLFSDMEDLPLVTRVLFGISGWLARDWFWILLLLVGAAVAAAFLRKDSGIRWRLDRMKLRMPVFGKFNQILCTARFARSLSSLYSGGAPILQALEIAGGTVGNSYIEAQFPRVLEQVRSGVSLSRALQRVDGFRYKLISAIAVGEESGQLDRMLRGTADTMDFDAQQASKRMLTILEPALVVVMAVLVGCIMLGVMLPMVQSYGIIEGRTYY